MSFTAYKYLISTPSALLLSVAGLFCGQVVAQDHTSYVASDGRVYRLIVEGSHIVGMESEYADDDEFLEEETPVVEAGRKPYVVNDPLLAKLPAKTVVLTFDDGPHPIYTKQVRQVLADYKVKATFFQLGRRLGALDDSDEVKLFSGALMSKKLLEDGHVLGNHSYSHPSLPKVSEEKLNFELDTTERLLEAIDPSPSKLFRFPYGAESEATLSAVKDRGLTPVRWNVDSLDWKDKDSQSIANWVLEGVHLQRKNKAIILFHDTHKQTVHALPIVLKSLIDDGYKFATWTGLRFEVDELSGVGVSPEVLLREPLHYVGNTSPSKSVARNTAPSAVAPLNEDLPGLDAVLEDSRDQQWIRY